MSEPRRACSAAAGDAEPVNLGVPVPVAGDAEPRAPHWWRTPCPSFSKNDRSQEKGASVSDPEHRHLQCPHVMCVPQECLYLSLGF